MTIFLIGLVVNLPLFNYFMSARPHLIFSSQYVALSINSGRPERKQERKTVYKLTKPRSHSDVTFVQRRLARL